MSHGNLAIFVPHMGCPQQCSFCDQRRISGTEKPPTPQEVEELCGAAAPVMARRGTQGEIAFFGGSFTAIPRPYMEALLKAAAPFVEEGPFSGIRISTRPDAIDQDILRLLRRYHVTWIELGAQSMNERVLEQNRRGHTAAQVGEASARIKGEGFALGLQMMTGLYGASPDTDRETMEALVALHPDAVRVYPTLVVEGTYLAQLYRRGQYQPQTLEEAVSLRAELLEGFGEAGIPVIRMGLHADPELEKALVAGPYHPAFRELCEGAVLYNRIARLLAGKSQGCYIVFVSPKAVSKLKGHGALGLKKLSADGYEISVKQDPVLDGLEVRIGE